MATGLVPALAQPGIFGGVTGPPPALGGGGDTGFGIRPFLGLNGTFVSNRTDLSAYDPNSNRFLNSDTFGGSILGGVTGVKQFRRTSLGVMYRGLGRYTGSSHSFSSSHFLGLSLVHQATERLSFSLSQTAGTAEGGIGFGAMFGGLGAYTGFGSFSLVPGAAGFNPYLPSLGNPGSNNLVDDEALDTRTYFASSSGDATYRLTERSWVSAGASGFFVRRKEQQFGLNGFSIRGSNGYILSSRANVAIHYSFSRFDYVRAYNNTQVQTLGGSFNYDLTSRTTFSVSGGAVRWHSDFIGVVPLDPILADLLGQTTGLAIQKLNRYSYYVAGDLNRVMQHGTLGLSYRRGAVPGNGILLGAERQIASASYGFNNLDRWTFGVEGGYATARGVVQRSYTTQSFVFRGNAGYRFYRGLSARLGAGYRIFQLPNRPHVNQILVYVGLSWSPGEIPVTF